MTNPQSAHPQHYRQMGQPPAAYRPPHPVAVPQPVQPRPLAPWQREEILTRYVQEQAKCGQHVHQRGAASATLYGPAVWLPVGVHLALTLVTLGVWAIVWAMMQRSRRWRQVHVDQWGRLQVTIVRHGALI